MPTTHHWPTTHADSPHTNSARLELEAAGGRLQGAGCRGQAAGGRLQRFGLGGVKVWAGMAHLDDGYGRMRHRSRDAVKQCAEAGVDVDDEEGAVAAGVKVVEELSTCFTVTERLTGLVGEGEGVGGRG